MSMMDIKQTEKSLKLNVTTLHMIIHEYITFFNNNPSFFNKIKNDYKISIHLLNDIQAKAGQIYKTVENMLSLNHESLFKDIRTFLLNDYGIFIDLLKIIFYQIIFYTNKVNILDLVTSSEESDINFIAGNYLLLLRNFKTINNLIKQFFFKDIKLKDELVVNDETELWLVSDMVHEVFASDISKVRDISQELTKVVEDSITPNAQALLNQQVSELVKNAIKHGNKSDQSKLVKAWYKFTDQYYKIIVEDQGDGFKNLEEWNQFNKNRNQAITTQNMEDMMKYIAYKSSESDDSDGGNALFAAMEYWDSGLILNGRKNKVLAIKYFFV